MQLPLACQVAYACFFFTPLPQNDLKHFNSKPLGRMWLPGNLSLGGLDCHPDCHSVTWVYPDCHMGISTQGPMFKLAAGRGAGARLNNKNHCKKKAAINAKK